MLYYPGFEVKDINWLKFALLYLDDLRPIIPQIPYTRENYLDSLTLKIMDSTDLIREYCPDYKEGNIASLKAMEYFDNYLKNPKIYANQFNSSYGHANYLPDKWRNKAQQNYILYTGKFSTDFYYYCIDEGIAHPCDEGIKIHEDLAFVYMSFLAEVISEANEMEAITDISKYNKIILNNNKILSKTIGKELKYAINNIELNLPCDISKISIDKFIKLRSSRGFSQLRTAYTNEIKNLIEAKEQKNYGYSLENLLSYQKDFVRFCHQSFNMLGSIYLTAFGIHQIAGDNLTPIALLSTAIGVHQNLNAVVKAGEITETFKDIHNKHLARKYVATLRRTSL